MNIFDQMAEGYISKALAQGDLDNLPGKGKPLQLDDDSQVPESLRAGYRVLKNAGYIPPELQQRQDALQLCDLLQSVGFKSKEQLIEHPDYRKLQQLELKMRIKGINTAFIHRYLRSLPVNY
ncbi:DnaJ family domain-containing protein [Celerinatantimonas sp. MCCC 1A17872]|uniref:DnaJ family domain-containing protein n=1 Tax=Celerinatantimonas sp. MCCC 1A17872 TaxID=3177514 RepID=UPI0038C1A4F0